MKQSFWAHLLCGTADMLWKIRFEQLWFGRPLGSSASLAFWGEMRPRPVRRPSFWVRVVHRRFGIMRFLALVLSALLVAVPAFADPSIVYDVADVSLNKTAGWAVVSVNATLDEGDLVAAVLFTLEYDSTQVMPTDVSIGADAATAGWELVRVNLDCCYSWPPSGSNKRILVWYGGDGITEGFGEGWKEVGKVKFVDVGCGVNTTLIGPDIINLNNAATLDGWPLDPPGYGGSFVLTGCSNKPVPDPPTWSMVKRLFR